MRESGRMNELFITILTGIFVGVVGLLAGCASAPPLPEALDSIAVGMDKDKVLESVGNPQRTYREESQDHWIYIYYSKDKEWRRDIVFAAGKVVRVTRPQAKEEWVKELENTTSMEEYENKVRARQGK
jgi:outer membrane protein assembly factor BamE (lipoprotein component of BamABCDE complex)